jgi:hypothetical protein
MSESLTTKQVAEHNTVDKGLYIIIDGEVYKMDTFVEEHPGGSKILKRVGGKDASKQFWKVCFVVPHSSNTRSNSMTYQCISQCSMKIFMLMISAQYHNESVLKKYAPKLKIGTVKEEAKL